MVTKETVAARVKEGPTQDELTAILWTKEMGQRMALIRMKMLKEQKEIGAALGVTQSTISRIEIGHLRVCDRFTVADFKRVFGTFFAFIMYGANPERFNAGYIISGYWDTRLRIKRANKGPYSKRRFQG